MESEQVSSSCSSSSPSPSPSPSSSSTPEDAADRTELEAAEALADLAQLAIMREKVVESAAKWGSKGKRVRKRIKNESLTCDSRLKPADLEPPAPDLAEVQTVQEEVQAQAISRGLTIGPVKTEVDDETGTQLVSSTPRCRSNGGGRWRHNLSEAEKEERRIRRILANRESARQTIRRRQAMCEELNRKASDLSYENAQLKREKDWVLKEFQSLETINKNLREQLSRTMTPKPKESEEASKVTQLETSTTTPFYFYNQHPFQLFCWPPVIQSPNSAVLPQNGFTVPSTSSQGASTKIAPSQEQDDRPKAPFYIVPCPWFLPPPDQSNEVQTVAPCGMKTAQEGCSSNDHHRDNSSARPIDNTIRLLTHMPTKVDSGSKCIRPLYDLNDCATEIPSEGGDAQVIGFQPEQHSPSSFFKHEDASQLTNGINPVTPGHVLVSLPDKSQRYVEYSSKRLVDSVAAAEARKRRKELTRLKNLNGRQCRMQV